MNPFEKVAADMERKKTHKYLLEKGIISDKPKEEKHQFKCFHCQTFEGNYEEVQNHQTNCRKI